VLVTGGFGAIVNGINDKGQAVGYYTTTNSTNGFLYSNGKYTTIDVPGATATVLQGINDKGQIVGYYELGSSNTPHGFLYSGGTFINIDEPLATNGTVVTGINNKGEIVGYYQDSSGLHGFDAMPTMTSAHHDAALLNTSHLDIGHSFLV
jgi:probable HAF family extracellular repeat protein